MCGIAGAVWSHPRQEISAAVLSRMTTALRHRGPDDAGHLFSREIRQQRPDRNAWCALGHRRLSIIDVGGGHQPLSNEDGSVWIVFNGEIYNYRELQVNLQRRGHQFATSTDTEVIVHLYEDHGADCVQWLRGMFAFAIWDERCERLLLARDRIGKKPLHYRQEGQRLVFASEIKALLQLPDAPREVDPQALDSYLTYQYTPHPRTMLQGVCKLPPAHTAVYERGELQLTRYWRAGYEPDASHEPLRDWTGERWRRELRERLTESVRLRMRSDVPIGAFLSGGVDSTIISGLMQSLSATPIHTFSIGFHEAEYDESRFARMAAQQIGSEHHETIVRPEALQLLPRLIWHYDEPFSDSSAIPMMVLSEVTRKLVTVALSGDGGDELFAGYPRYQAVALAHQSDWLPRPVKSLLGANIWQQIPTSTRQRAFGRRLKRFLQALGQTPERRYLRWIGIFDEQQRRELYTSQFAARLDGFDSSQFLLDAYNACPKRDFVTRTTCVDVETYLPCDILTKVDIATMAASIEARSPFLDQEVIELAARMPIELKYQHRRGKRVLLETFSDLVPAAIQQRSKMGFGVPIDHWFRNELRHLLEGVLLSERAMDRGIFKREAVQKLLSDHLQGRWDHAYRLWNLLCLECWQRMYVDQPAPISAPDADSGLTLLAPEAWGSLVAPS